MSITRDENGSNLSRAIAPARKKERGRRRRPGEPLFSVRIDAFAIEDASLSLRTEGRERELRLTHLDASGRYEAGRAFIDTELRAEGRVNAPAEGPLTLEARAHRDDGGWNGRVQLQAAGATVLAEGASEGPHTQIELLELVLPPDVTQAVLPQWPLVAVVRGQGRLVREGPDFDVKAELEAASARVALEGHLDLETSTSRGIQLDVRDLNLAELVREGPRSDIDLQLRAVGGGRSLETLTGELLVTAPASSVGGAEFGPVRIEADARQGVVSLRELKVRAPGLSLTAQGQATPEEVKLGGTAVAGDLGLFARTLGRLAGPAGLPLDGHGHATFRLEGPTRNPTLSIRARFPVLNGRSRSRAGWTSISRSRTWGFGSSNSEAPGRKSSPPPARRAR